MTSKQGKTETPKLMRQARIELAIERLWAEEAVHRDADLDNGTASMRDAEDVFEDARARLSQRKLTT